VNAKCYMSRTTEPCQGLGVRDLEVWDNHRAPTMVKICEAHAEMLAAEMRLVSTRAQAARDLLLGAEREGGQ
jgi:hypothetical protein